MACLMQETGEKKTHTVGTHTTKIKIIDKRELANGKRSLKYGNQIRLESCHYDKSVLVLDNFRILNLSKISIQIQLTCRSLPVFWAKI